MQSPFPLSPRSAGGDVAERQRGGGDLLDELEGSGFERLPAMVDCASRSALDAGLAEVLSWGCRNGWV